MNADVITKLLPEIAADAPEVTGADGAVSLLYTVDALPLRATADLAAIRAKYTVLAASQVDVRANPYQPPIGYRVTLTLAARTTKKDT